MSRFSGKCDFCDEIEIFGLDYILGSDVYVGDSDEPLKLTCLADCIPYYPYIITVAVHDNAKGKGCIELTKKSWVDIEEERYGHHAIHDMYRKFLQEEMERVANELN